MAEEGTGGTTKGNDAGGKDNKPGASAAAAAGAAGTAAKQQQQGKKQQKGPPAGITPKPKLTKAERRALQEKQRAAKAAAKQQQQQQGGGGGQKQQQQHQQQQHQKQGKHQQHQTQKTAADSSSNTDANAAAAAGDEEDAEDRVSSSVPMFSHLKPYQHFDRIFSLGATLRPKAVASHHHQYERLHPAVLRLGYQYATGEIRGGNARCRAMLACFQTLLLQTTEEGEKEDQQRQQPLGKQPDKNASTTGGSSTTDWRVWLDQQWFKPAFTYWTEHCRAHSVTMGNAFTFLKAAVANLDRTLPLREMKQVLSETLEAYTYERIDYADKAIAKLACKQLFTVNTTVSSSSTTTCSSGTTTTTTTTRTTASSLRGDKEEVILIYGYSEVIAVLLKEQQQRAAAAAAAEQQQDATTREGAAAESAAARTTAGTTKKTSASSAMKRFRVIVVDSHPLLEGRRMLRELREAGISCTYVLLHAVTYVVQDVTKVLLGAAALLSDGSVLGRVGSAAVALVAASRHVPVLVVAETYKISNRVQLESITGNELGNPLTVARNNGKKQNGGFAASSSEQQWQEPLAGAAAPAGTPRGQPQPLNLLYDLTPASFVSGIVTELGIVPPTSVAVLLREMNPVAQQQSTT